MTAGFKHVGFLTKRDDQTLEEFYHHWKTVHSDLARRVSGLRKYVINPIDRTLRTTRGRRTGLGVPRRCSTFADVANFIGYLAGANIDEVEIVARH